MKANREHKKCGIYCIKNLINNKVYIGKSRNIHRRIITHISALNTKNKDENPYLINSWHKYGRDNFQYFVLEFLDENENLVKERELYWIKKYNSTNSKFGYNLRMDSSTSMIVHKETSRKISKRLKKEWANGLRNSHGEKLKASWKRNPNRRTEQSKLMSEILTKYLYKLYNPKNILIEICNYKRLKELNLKNCQETFCRKKLNKIKFKGYIIEKVLAKDIVQTN